MRYSGPGARERPGPSGDAPARLGKEHHYATSQARRFPPLWTVEETDACFIVSDANGQALAYVYFEDEPGRSAAKLLTHDEARRIAANIAKLLELLRKVLSAARACVSFDHLVGACR